MTLPVVPLRGSISNSQPQQQSAPASAAITSNRRELRSHWLKEASPRSHWSTGKPPSHWSRATAPCVHWLAALQAPLRGGDSAILSGVAEGGGGRRRWRWEGWEQLVFAPLFSSVRSGPVPCGPRARPLAVSRGGASVSRSSESLGLLPPTWVPRRLRC